MPVLPRGHFRGPKASGEEGWNSELLGWTWAMSAFPAVEAGPERQRRVPKATEQGLEVCSAQQPPLSGALPGRNQGGMGGPQAGVLLPGGRPVNEHTRAGYRPSPASRPSRGCRGETSAQPGGGSGYTGTPQPIWSPAPASHRWKLRPKDGRDLLRSPSHCLDPFLSSSEGLGALQR